MKRTQAWEPNHPNPGPRFVTEWDDAEVCLGPLKVTAWRFSPLVRLARWFSKAMRLPTTHVCISATLDGVPLKDPQQAYERAVASFLKGTR